MNFLVKMGTGWAIRQLAPWISKRVGQFFESYLKVAADNIKNLDNLLEEKTGMDLFPADTQEKYDNLVGHVVEYVEAACTDQAKIRFVLNAICRGDNGLSKDLLADWAGKSWQDFLANLPADLKPIISQAKENLALNLIEKIWSSLTNSAPPPREAIKASITNIVRAKNLNHATVTERLPEESFSALFERLAQESKERQEKLNAETSK